MLEFFRLLKIQKNKILVGFFSIFIFLAVFFPFSDLSTFITTEVAKLTQNQLFLQFDEMNLSFFPRLGASLGKVSIDTGELPTIKTDQLALYPSPLGLLTQTPSGTVVASGLFRGNVEVKLGNGSKSEAGTARQKIEIKVDKINLSELKDFRQIPLTFKGQLSLQGKIQTDLALSEQPDADIEIQAEKFELPSQAVNTMMGPLNLPDLRLGRVTLKGKLIGGRLTIEEGKIGQDGDDIRGELKGGLTLNIRNQNGIYPEVGAYTFDLDLTFKKSVEEKLNVFLSMISQFKTATTEGSRYQVRISAQNPGFPPSMNPLR